MAGATESDRQVPNPLGDFYAEQVHSLQFAAPEQHLQRYRTRVVRELSRCGIAVEHLRGKVVFDIGSGFQALVFHELGCAQVYHVDISPKQVAWLRTYCAARGIDNVHSDCVDVMCDLGRMQHFDVAFICGVYQHLVTPGKLLLALGERAIVGASIVIRCYRSGTWSRWLTAQLRTLSVLTTPQDITNAYLAATPVEQQNARFLADMRDDLFVPVWGAYHPNQFAQDAKMLGWKYWTDEPDFVVDFNPRDENFRVRFNIMDSMTPTAALLDAVALNSNRSIDQHGLDVTDSLDNAARLKWDACIKQCARAEPREMATQLVSLYACVRGMAITRHAPDAVR